MTRDKQYNDGSLDCQAKATRQSMQAAVQVMRSNPRATNPEIFELLIKGGMDRSMAVQLVYLLPTAYTRLILADSVAYFPETYLCNDGKGGVREWNRFDEIPLWPEVIAFAKHEISSGVKGDALGLVAGRCAEFDAINQALHAGESIENLVCMPPMFMLQEFSAAVGLRPRQFFWQAWRDQAMSTVGSRAGRIFVAIVLGIGLLMGVAAAVTLVYAVVWLLRFSVGTEQL